MTGRRRPVIAILAGGSLGVKEERQQGFELAWYLVDLPVDFSPRLASRAAPQFDNGWHPVYDRGRPPMRPAALCPGSCAPEMAR